MSIGRMKMCSISSQFKRRGLPWMILAVCCCCYCALVFTVAQAQPGAQEEKTKAPALELKLSAYESKVCPGSSLTLTLEMANTSQQQIKIHRSNLWSQFSFLAVGKGLSGSSISCGVSDDRPESWIVLEPEAKYYDTFTYQFEYNDLFQAAGHYKISTRLPFYAAGQYNTSVASNEVEFEIYDCAAK